MSTCTTPSTEPHFVASQFGVVAVYGRDDAAAAINARDRLVRHDWDPGGEGCRWNPGPRSRISTTEGRTAARSIVDLTPGPVVGCPAQTALYAPPSSGRG
jgi:hypothetical protein